MPQAVQDLPWSVGRQGFLGVNPYLFRNRGIWFLLPLKDHLLPILLPLPSLFLLLPPLQYLRSPLLRLLSTRMVLLLILCGPLHLGVLVLRLLTPSTSLVFGSEWATAFQTNGVHLFYVP